MPASFTFEIRPLSIERGFALDCDGIIDRPLHVNRLFEAVVASAQIGQGLDAEIRIFDVDGQVAEVLELAHEAPALCRRNAA